MHGMTLGHEYYAEHLDHWASHGIVALFPYVESPEKDDAVFPIVTETDGSSIIATVGFANQTNANSDSPLHGLLDMGHLGIAGHSMGGEDTIKATAKLPKGTARVVISQHPALCGPFGPPPYPATYSKEELGNATLNVDMLMLTTSDNDRAFLPGTPDHERGCWESGAQYTGPHKAIFAQFAKANCSQYPPCNTTSCSVKVDAVGSGHMCACAAPFSSTPGWQSPELPWVTAALKLWLHLDGDSSSGCYNMIWADDTSAGPDTLQGTNATSKVEFSSL